MKITIQPAKLDYVEGFLMALDVVARERKYLLFTEAPPMDETIEFVKKIIAKEWSQFYALDGEKVVGWCDVGRNERTGMTHSGHLGMGVIPEYRGMGIGQRLLEATMADAFSKGIERIEMEAFASNEAAICLYRKMGFVEEGRKRKARFLDGNYDDFILMALLGEKPGVEPASLRSAVHGG